MQFPDISASMLALKALKYEGKPLARDEVVSLLDQVIELFFLRNEVSRLSPPSREGVVK